MHKTRRWEPVAGLIFCYGNEENGHCACASRHLTTANQSGIRKAYLVSVGYTQALELAFSYGIYTSLGAGFQLWDIHKPERWLSIVAFTY